MKITSITALLSSYAVTQVSAKQMNLRSRNLGQNVKASKCTILLREELLINPGQHDHAFECEMDAEDMNGIPNLTLPLQVLLKCRN
jgi:hypothetical protein